MGFPRDLRWGWSLEMDRSHDKTLIILSFIPRLYNHHVTIYDRIITLIHTVVLVNLQGIDRIQYHLA